MQLTKYVLPVVVGTMSGMVLIRLGETWVRTTYDVLPVMMPGIAFILLAVIYMVGSFFAGAIATMVSGRVEARPAVVVGIVITLAGLYNVFNMLHPGWFVVANVAIYLPFAYLGFLVTRKKSVVA